VTSTPTGSGSPGLRSFRRNLGKVELGDQAGERHVLQDRIVRCQRITPRFAVVRLGMDVGVTDPCPRGLALGLDGFVLQVAPGLDLDDELFGFGLDDEIGFVALGPSIFDLELLRACLRVPTNHLGFMLGVDEHREAPLFIGLERLMREGAALETRADSDTVLIASA
jgi:hypothetical protein